MFSGSSDDFIRRFQRLEEKVRRLQTRKPGGRTSENFIMDPVTVRALPPGIAVKSKITAVRARLGSGGPVQLQFRVNGTVIHTFSSLSGNGNVVSENVEHELEPEDLFDVNIVSGSGNNLTATFVVIS